MEKEQLLNAIENMPIRSEGTRRLIYFLGERKKAAFSLVDVFNYGYMKGVQAERARRRKAATTK